jgi:hypothetical protein
MPAGERWRSSRPTPPCSAEGDAGGLSYPSYKRRLEDRVGRTRHIRLAIEDELLSPRWRDPEARGGWQFRVLVADRDRAGGDILAAFVLAAIGYVIDAFLLQGGWLSLLSTLPLVYGLIALALYAAVRIPWRRMSLAQRLGYLEHEGQWNRLLHVTDSVPGKRTAIALTDAVRSLRTLRETIASLPQGSLAGAISKRADEAADAVSSGLWPQVELLASVKPVGQAGEKALDARIVRVERMAVDTMDAAAALSALALTHGVGARQEEDADEALRRLRESAEALAAPL